MSVIWCCFCVPFVASVGVQCVTRSPTCHLLSLNIAITQYKLITLRGSKNSLRSSLYPLEVFALWFNYKTGVLYVEYFIIQPNSCKLNHFAFMCNEAWTCRDQESELSDYEWIVHTSDYYSFMGYSVQIPDSKRHEVSPTHGNISGNTRAT